MIQQTVKAVRNQRGIVHLGKGVATDVIKKGFHLYFDGGVELSSKMLDNGSVLVFLISKRLNSLN